MGYYERAAFFYQGLDTIDKLLDHSSSPVSVGESFLKHELDLRTFSPSNSLSFYVAVTSQVIDRLGFPTIFDSDLKAKDKLSDQEIKVLIQEGFDGNFASSIVHLALYRFKKIENQTKGKIHRNIGRHLDDAETHLKLSSASDRIKSKPELAIELFKSNLKK